jgi:hypothetical protein
MTAVFFHRRCAIELPVIPDRTRSAAAGRTGKVHIPETIRDVDRDADHEHDTK